MTFPQYLVTELSRTPTDEPYVVRNMRSTTQSYVSLSSSVDSVAAVVAAVVNAKIREGDAICMEATRAKYVPGYIVQPRAFASATARDNVFGCEFAYFAAKFGAALSPDLSSPFTLTSNPYMSEIEYLARLVRMSGASASCLLGMMVLLKRMDLSRPDLYLHSGRSHFLLLAAFSLSLKSNEHFSKTDKDLACMGGVSVTKLAQLESAFVDGISHGVCVTKADIEELHIPIIQEAIDSQYGLKVLQTLRTARVSGLNEAIKGTAAWQAIDWRVVGEEEGDISLWLATMWNRSIRIRGQLKRCTVPNSGILEGVSYALLKYYTKLKTAAHMRSTSPMSVSDGEDENDLNKIEKCVERELAACPLEKKAGFEADNIFQMAQDCGVESFL